MDSLLVERSRKYAFEQISKYTGKLGKHFFKAMLLALEKQAEQACANNPKLHKNALLIGIYFHELGRIKSEEHDHIEHSVQLFDDFVKDATVTDQTIEIVHDCCYNHVEQGIPVTKEGTFVKNWHWAIAFEPETLLARIEDLQEQGKTFSEAKELLFDHLEYDYRSIADPELKAQARETLATLKESLED